MKKCCLLTISKGQLLLLPRKSRDSTLIAISKSSQIELNVKLSTDAEVVVASDGYSELLKASQ